MRVREELDALLASPHVTDATRRTLEARLGATFRPQVLSAPQYAILQAAARRLVPADPALFSPGEPDLAGAVDERLALGLGDGWRYDDTPPDLEALGGLLDALGADFAAQSGEGQDARLRGLQTRAPHAFEDLLAELTEIYVSHPLVQLSLGVAPFADVPGWSGVGLNERDAWEPPAAERPAHG